MTYSIWNFFNLWGLAVKSHNKICSYIILVVLNLLMCNCWGRKPAPPLSLLSFILPALSRWLNTLNFTPQIIHTPEDGWMHSCYRLLWIMLWCLVQTLCGITFCAAVYFLQYSLWNCLKISEFDKKSIWIWQIWLIRMFTWMLVMSCKYKCLFINLLCFLHLLCPLPEEVGSWMLCFVQKQGQITYQRLHFG